MYHSNSSTRWIATCSMFCVFLFSGFSGFAQQTFNQDVLITRPSGGLAIPYLVARDASRTAPNDDIFNLSVNVNGANSTDAFVRSSTGLATLGVTQQGTGFALSSRVNGTNPGLVVIGNNSREFYFGQNFTAVASNATGTPAELGTLNRPWGSLFLHRTGAIDVQNGVSSVLNIDLGLETGSGSFPHALVINGAQNYTDKNYLAVQAPGFNDLFIIGQAGRVSSNVPNGSQAAQLHARGAGNWDVMQLDDSNGDPLMKVTESGEVQVGQDGNQGRRLVVNGNGDAVVIERESSIWQDTQVKLGISSNTGPAGLRFQVSDDNGANWTDALHIANNGNIGIGTTDMGTYKLAVEGKIGAREVRVTQSSWADFVFEEDYELMPLEAVASYIADHKHLPDVPSEAEVLESGNNLGDMDALLLQKIEELTLYVIQLKEENAALADRNQAIESRLNQVEGESK